MEATLYPSNPMGIVKMPKFQKVLFVSVSQKFLDSTSVAIRGIGGLEVWRGGGKIFARKIKRIWRAARIVVQTSYCSFRAVARMKWISAQLRWAIAPCHPFSYAYGNHGHYL